MSKPNRAPKSNLTTVSLNLKPQGGQNAEMVEVVEYHAASGDKIHLRMTVHSDGSYVNQSYARIEHFAGGEWRNLHNIMPTSVATKGGGYSHAAGTVAFFAADRAELLRVAGVLLGLSL